MACTAGCKTQNCESYAACLRNKSAGIYMANSAKGFDLTAQRRWDANLDSYRAARKEGLQPATTAQRDIDAARRIADQTGSPVNP